MGKIMGLRVNGCAGQSLRPGAHLNPAVILLASFILFVYCSLQASAQDSKGVKVLKVIKNGKSVILYEASYALLIGVSEYEYWPDLKSIPKEISLLESSLKQNGFIIERSLNPTSEELRKTIKDFIDQYGFERNNRLLIFFSGHGYTRRDGQKGYIVPGDAADPLGDEITFAKKAIEMEQILTWAKRIEAKHALFVFDSCFSGTILQTRGSLPPPYITHLTGKPVRQFITAGIEEELLPGKSYFVPCFIRGIEREADTDRDGYITGNELGLYLQKKIIGYKIGQTPWFGKIRDPNLDQGDFVFIMKTQKSATVSPITPIERIEVKDNILIAPDQNIEEKAALLRELRDKGLDDEIRKAKA